MRNQSVAITEFLCQLERCVAEPAYGPIFIKRLKQEFKHHVICQKRMEALNILVNTYTIFQTPAISACRFILNNNIQIGETKKDYHDRYATDISADQVVKRKATTFDVFYTCVEVCRVIVDML
jgi:hypothetical protein